MICQSCGRQVAPSTFCGACGAPLTPHAPPTVVPASASTTSSATPLIIGVAALAVLTVIAIGIVGWLYLGGQDPQATPAGASTRAPAPASEVPSPDPATPSTAPSPSRPAAVTSTGPGDVRTLPAGLFCRDLHARGYSYVAAVDYWRAHGQPNQMDVERNGIPCETVYPTADVTAYWGPRPQAEYVYDEEFEQLPSGLFCRDLRARGLSYPRAVAYWSYWGRPDAMDADLNGIPCETVYPAGDVTAYW